MHNDSFMKLGNPIRVIQDYVREVSQNNDISVCDSNKIMV